MEIKKVIKLSDGSVHQTKRQAESHLINILSRGENSKLFEDMANKSALKLKDFFVENQTKIENTMKIVRELNDVLNADFF